jgi:hypothetical protein
LANETFVVLQFSLLFPWQWNPHSSRNYFSMRQFSLKRLFASMTLIAAGCGAFMWLAQWKVPAESGPIKSYMPYLIVVGFVFIGMGIGNLFKRPMNGGILGFVAFIIVALVMIFTVNMR